MDGEDSPGAATVVVVVVVGELGCVFVPTDSISWDADAFGNLSFTLHPYRRISPSTFQVLWLSAETEDVSRL